jgi:hypothetical protein
MRKRGGVSDLQNQIQTWFVGCGLWVVGCGYVSKVGSFCLESFGFYLLEEGVFVGAWEKVHVQHSSCFCIGTTTTLGPGNK